MVRIQEIYEGKGKKKDQANTHPAGTTTSHKAPLVWSRALSMDATPTSRLSHSMLSAMSSRVKRVDVDSCRLEHQSRGSPYVGESPPTNVRARDDSPPAPSTNVPLAMMSLAIEGVYSTSVDLSTSTRTSKDPSAMSPSVWPMKDSVAWASDGAGR